MPQVSGGGTVTGLNRRDFLKALGVSGGASALSACGLDTNNYTTPVEYILPYVVKPEQVTPGTPTFFATTVLRGPHARSVTARHRDGRVIFVSHNRYAPGRAAVSPADMFELQKHYSPDRLTGPTDGGAATTWEAGLSKLADAVKAAKASGKSVAFLGGYKSGAITQLLSDFTDGGAVYWEPTGYEAEVAASEKLFGVRALPFYGFDKADYVLSFGAPFLSGVWGDADTEERYATARDPNVGHSIVRFALVAPHRDQTGVNSDDWLACTPGSEAVVARAVAAAVASRNGASAALVALIGNVSLADAAAASGLSEEALASVVENVVSHKTLAVPGGPRGSTDLAAAVYLLNLAAGAAPERFHLGGYAGPVHGWSDISALIDALNAGKVGVLLVDDANPVYGLPEGTDFAAAAAKADLVVSVSSHPDETQALAGLSLPTSDAFEDWGDEAPRPGVRLLRQPSMTPLNDTRSLGDILLSVGRAAGLGVSAAVVEGEEAAAPAGLGFSPETWQDYVQASWKANVFTGGSFEDFWETSVIQGVNLTEVAPVAPELVASSYAFGSTDLAGSGDLTLVAYPHPFRHDGRYANQPWAQEVPDPTTGQVWNSWVEVHTATANKIGVKTGDAIAITTEAGSATVGVQVIRSVPEGVLALAFGNGHAEIAGRYAKNYGINAAKLFKTAADAQGNLSWAPVKASATAAGKAKLVSTFSQFSTTTDGETFGDDGRAFGVWVDAHKLAAVGDAEAHHAGELTGIHHLELDERLQERKIDGFYGMPDHSTYRFGLTVDINACNGCGACSIACYAENNLPVVGPDKVGEGREMGWIRVNRYWETDVGGQDDIQFVPMMCQQCGHAGCENVCPVLATYHNIDGLNAMVYNRCVGTRYCSNACPFSVRRFNYHTYQWPEPFNLQLNPDVTTREMGVMEKCTFCVQRLRQVKSAYKDVEGFTAVVPDEAWRNVPACVEACPSQALVFGNLNDEEGHCSKTRKSARTYQPLEELRVFSAVNYLAKASFHDDPTAHHGGGHGDAAEGGHAEAAHGDNHDAEAAPKADAHGEDAH